MHGYSYISADLIAEELSSGKLDEVRIRAGRLFHDRLSMQIKTGDSFLVESTLAGLSFQRFIQQMNNIKYITTIVFIFTGSVESCVARVRARVKKGGHHVPEADIERRFYRSCSNFWNLYRPLVHGWHLFYNGTAQFIDVAVGAGDDMDVLNERFLNRFVQIAGR